ncbi:hypothetical protein [Pseudomonas citronellolis]|uniref:hypothetical protein n=1 Tax=Pseudomonas citronellolis TaxID=53408 RepID=UPI0008536B84|nr:hypothetical protein [Pseudomonas humi]
MPPIEPRPATSILLLREAEEGTGLEVFMLLRNPQVAFCDGALVFPGGKVEQADGHARLRQHCLGADALDDDELRFRVAGLRELFEESGILLARRAGSEQPWLEEIGGIRHLCIPEDAGYPEAVFPLRPGAGF